MDINPSIPKAGNTKEITGVVLPDGATYYTDEDMVKLLGRPKRQILALPDGERPPYISLSPRKRLWPANAFAAWLATRPIK